MYVSSRMVCLVQGLQVRYERIVPGHNDGVKKQEKQRQRGRDMAQNCDQGRAVAS